MKTRIEALPADVFGLSDIARAALAGGAGFGPVPVPRRLEDLARPEERLGAEERGALVASIRAGVEGAGLALHAEAAARLDALCTEGVPCVVTGQQPGFLAAPLYSLYKALQACRAADELSARWNTPVVPVFWNHADDHDVAEVHHAWQLNRNLDLQKASLAGLSSGRVPVGELPIDAEAQRLDALRAQLRTMVEEHEGADAALDLFLPQHGETLARALSRILGELCGPYGLVVVEPEWIRPQLSSELGRIVSGPMGRGGLVDALRKGGDELRALDLEPPIPVGDADEDPAAAAALVYRHVPNADGAPERVALRAGGEGFVQDGESGSRTHAELGALIVGEPQNWSAGALLRPLVQDAVFPSCAYVGGWGELGYNAQGGPARDAAGLPRTPFLPRVSVVLVDDETRYALQRVEATLLEVLHARGEFTAAEDDAAEPDVVAALRAVAEDTRERLLVHRAALSDLEPALAITLKKTAGHVEQSIGKVIDKALRVHQNRAGKGQRQLRRVNNTLMPRGLPQERVLGPFQFVARHGPAFVEALRTELPALSSEPLALHIEEPPEG